MKALIFLALFAIAYASPTFYYYRNNWWPQSSCTCGKVSWQSSFTSKQSCVAAMCAPPTGGPYFDFNAKVAWPDCACAQVTYATQYGSQSACEDVVCDDYPNSEDSVSFYAQTKWWNNAAGTPDCDCGKVDFQTPYNSYDSCFNALCDDDN